MDVYEALSRFSEALLRCSPELLADAALQALDLAEQPDQEPETRVAMSELFKVFMAHKVHVETTLVNADPSGLWGDPEDAGVPAWGPSTAPVAPTDVVEPDTGLDDDAPDP